MSIEVRNLDFSYGAHVVLRDVGFSAPDGGLLAVLGPNGAGKTTLFKCILGILRHYDGSIRVDSADARALSPRALAHRIAYIPQAQAQAFGYSALEMVEMGTSHGVSPVSVPGFREAEAAREALERLKIGHLAEATFAHLSGGERQLVLIARALAQNARTLLMDEPTASLDYGNQNRVLQVVRGLADEGYAVVMSTHNPQHALWYADAALALSNSRVAAFGAPEDVVNAGLIETLYGVRARMIETETGPLIAPVVFGRGR